jgi:hypothetical protein
MRIFEGDNRISQSVLRIFAASFRQLELLNANWGPEGSRESLTSIDVADDDTSMQLPASALCLLFRHTAHRFSSA